MNSASKVGEIFMEAGDAFHKLAKLTLQLQPSADSPIEGKWTEEDIDMLQSAIIKFNEDLNRVDETIKMRTVSQIKSTCKKKKALEDAGEVVLSKQQQAKTVKPTEVAVIVLDAMEPGVDVVEIGDDIIFELESTLEEGTSEGLL